MMLVDSGGLIFSTVAHAPWNGHGLHLADFEDRKQKDVCVERFRKRGGICMRLIPPENAFTGRLKTVSSTPGGILDKAIEAEDKKHGDFMRLGYLELSAKTKTYFATAVSLWDSDFYVKVDDDVHVNIGNTLARLRSKPRVYIGCMNSGPILAKKGVRYEEPEHWKFGGEGNKYLRHATGQLYAISNDLVTWQ